MGIRLVTAALMPCWYHLTERARLTLIHMAHVAHDTGTPTIRRATWWEGNDKLAEKVLNIDPTQVTEPELAAARKKIQRALSELREAGAIELLEAPRPGRTAVYRVLSEQPILPVDNSEVDQANGHPMVDTPCPPLARNGGHPMSTISAEWWTNTTGMVDTPCPPEDVRGLKEEQTKHEKQIDHLRNQAETG